MACIDSHPEATTCFSVQGNPRSTQTPPPRAQAQKPLRGTPNTSVASENALIPSDSSFWRYYGSSGNCHRLFVASHRILGVISKSFLQANWVFCFSHRIFVATLLSSVAISRLSNNIPDVFLNSHPLSVASHTTLVASLRSSERRHQALVWNQKLSGAFHRCLLHISKQKQQPHV